MLTSITKGKKIGVVLTLIVMLALVSIGPSGMATAKVLPKAQAATTLNSPVVNPDRSVTFSLTAPQATDVKLNFQNQTGPSPAANAMDMTKNASGVWSITIGPLAPDMYGYDFIVDGVNILDPTNTYSGPGTVRAVWTGDPQFFSPVNAWSYVTVPGPEADFFADAAVPHGAVATVRYYSKLAQTERMMEVYTPPGYNHDNRGYPVLYIMHGAGGNETDWIINMRANFILDNLIAQGKAVPMILVSPNGNDATFPINGPITADNFSEELLGSIVPYIEENYRTAPGAQNRALAGLSLGGFWTLDTLLLHPGAFGYVGGFSSGWFTQAFRDDLVQNHSNLLTNPAINKDTKLLWITVGDQTDVAYTANFATLAILDQYHIKYTFVQGTGGHVWGTWRHNLLDFAPQLFRNGTK
jgi:enterochelin esterase-like enzyme